MAKRWTYDEDCFLLTWHRAVGASFVASHDLGRPESAGPRRLRHLDQTGASLKFAEAQILLAEFAESAGHSILEYSETMTGFWGEERERAKAAFRKYRGGPQYDA